MNILDFNDYSLYVSGDIHGEFKALFNEIKRRLRAYHLEHTVIAIAGDIGLGFNSLEYYKTTLKKINDFLSENDIFLIFIRGNHDDPSYFNEDKLCFSNIKAVPDYTILKTKDFTTLCVGGAISLDRSWRKNREIELNKYNRTNKKKLYWENEPFIYNENAMKEIDDNKINIDSVITHICVKSVPNMFTKVDEVEYWSVSDPFLKEDIQIEDKTIDKLAKKLNPHLKFWVSGHMHVNNYFLESNIAYLQLADTKQLIDVKNQLDVLNKSKKKKCSFKSIFSSAVTNNSIEIEELEIEHAAETEPIRYADLIDDEVLFEARNTTVYAPYGINDVMINYNTEVAPF